MTENVNILEVTQDNYNDTVVNNPKTVLLAIGAPWCVDCQRIQPMFMEMASRYADKLQFAHCDFDTQSALNDKFKVRHIPTLLVLKKGQTLATLVEPKKVELFEEFVQKALTL